MALVMFMLLWHNIPLMNMMMMILLAQSVAFAVCLLISIYEFSGAVVAARFFCSCLVYLMFELKNLKLKNF
jgi:hypothetical protein